MTNQTLKQTALDITDAACAVAMQHFRAPLGVEFKSDESPVTIADRSVETAVRDIISQRFPSHAIFGEEHGITPGTGDDLWIVDPIDGTRSFITGHPLFGFLLAKLTDKNVDLAVVAAPALNETFLAVRGNGASKNGKQINTSNQTELGSAVLYINEGEKIWRTSPSVFRDLMNAGQTRRFGYDCYPYVLLAAGHVDVVIDAGLQPYDYLPVSLLVQEAGGVMTNWSGDDLGMDADINTIAAATPELHSAVLDLLSS